MKKIIHLITITLIAVSSVTINAQSKSEILLNKVSKKMSNFDNMYMKFNYILENKEVDMRQETSGTVYTEGEKYNLEFMGNIFIYDSLNTYVILTEDEEINIVDANSDEDMLNPIKLLFFYKEGFTYQWDDLKTINGEQIQFIKLIPIDSESEASYFVLGINKSKIIHSIKEVGNNGTVTTFNIEYFKSNQDISKNLFIFNESKYTQKNYTINK
ncbi:outer membrane lipoprotein carrier protein LolA [Flavicella sp.]|uniref:LolA family protein n=1 Tax=Flavicella sp. TaxID=2957742 RepID=UPI003019613E